jgi:hypothetical protein
MSEDTFKKANKIGASDIKKQEICDDSQDKSRLDDTKITDNVNNSNLMREVKLQGLAVSDNSSVIEEEKHEETE